MTLRITGNVGSEKPVSDPKGYQELLISLVGTDDPAEVQSATPQRIRDLVADDSPDAVRALPTSA